LLESAINAVMATEADSPGDERQQYASAVLSAVAAGYLVTREGRIVDANPALCEMLGFTRDELIGLERPWPFTPTEAVAVTSAAAERITGGPLRSEGGFSDPFELPLVRKDGSRFVGEVVAAPARAADGTVLAWVSTVRDVSAHRDHELELERLATHDPLTGLGNRRLFEERLGQEMAHAIRHGRSLAVAIIDLDNFKDINDNHGHSAGDETLREAASRLENALRKGDLIARVGGDEFAWVLPEVLAEGAWSAVERARNAISADPFDGIGRITISIGFALRGDSPDAAVVYEQADQSLYRAKHEGRDRSIMWTLDLGGSDDRGSDG